MTAQHAGLAETSPPADHRLVEDVRAGLTADPPTLPPRWFYDEKGSALFEQITRLERVEMWLRALVPVTAHFRRMDFTWMVPAAGRLLTETSAKFRVKGLHEELHRAGLDPTHTWTDPAGDYSVTLATMSAARVPR